MKKLLLSTVCCLLTVFAIGQQATWNAAPENINSWVYSFAGGDGEPLSGNSINNTSTAGAPGFLPVPSSGTAFIRTGSTAAPVFTLGGVTDALSFRASTITDNTNLAKFGFRGIANTTAITSINFSISFSHADAEWMLAVGKSSATSGIFAGTSSLTASGGLDLRKASFAAFRWGQGGIKNLEFIRHDVEGVLETTHPVLSTYDVGTYQVELLCNNSGDNQYYTKNGVQYSIPSRHFHFWINGNRMELSTGVYNFPANGLTTGDEINSLMIQGKNPNSTGGTSDVMTISGLNIQSAAVATVLPVSLTSFTGRALNNDVVLSWQTASESNSSHFDILRFSAEDNNPVKIGEVSGSGNSVSLVNYSFTDKQALAGVNYYQLRQVDTDGKTSLSSVISVKSFKIERTEFWLIDELS